MSLMVTFVALLLLMRLVLALFGAGTSELSLGVTLAAVVFLGTAAGAAAGAWQAAAGGAPSRASTALAGAAGPALLGSTVSVALSLGESISLGRTILELTMVVAGALAGASLVARRRRGFQDRPTAGRDPRP